MRAVTATIFLLAGAAAGAGTPDLALVSQFSAGAAAGESSEGVISDDGRFAAFESDADGLVADDDNGTTDVFVRDLTTGAIECVSRLVSGAPAGECDSPDISADGRFVAFIGRTSGQAGLTEPPTAASKPQIYRHDRQNHVTQCLSLQFNGNPANEACFAPRISGNGSAVVFSSSATNLVPNDLPDTHDVFRSTGDSMAKVSRPPDGVPAANGASVAPDLDFDGTAVVFSSAATNLTSSADTNGVQDVFVWRFISSPAAAFLQRLTPSGTLEPNGESLHPSISADGQVIAFTTEASNFVDGDVNGVADVLVLGLFDFAFQRRIVSRASSGAQGSEASGSARLSADGRFVVFSSRSPEFGPSSGFDQVWLHDRSTAETRLVSADAIGQPATSGCFEASVASGGSRALFTCFGSALVAADTNASADVYLRRLARFEAGQTLAGDLAALAAPQALLVRGVKGMKLRIGLEAAPPGTKVEARLFDPKGKLRAKKVLAAPVGSLVSKTIKLDRDGTSTLELRAIAGPAAGAFRVATERILPKKARSGAKQLWTGKFSADGLVALRLYPGSAVATRTLLANKAVPGTSIEYSHQFELRDKTGKQDAATFAAQAFASGADEVVEILSAARVLGAQSLSFSVVSSVKTSARVEYTIDPPVFGDTVPIP